MHNKSKLSLAIAGLSILIAIFTLVLPSIYIEANSRIVMGWISTFGGVIKNYNGSDIHVRLSAGGLINFIVPVVAGVLAYFFGKSQKSTYFLTFVLFIVNIVLSLSTLISFQHVNVGGAIIGIKSAVLSVGPYVCVALASIGAIVSLVGLLYKPSSRFNKKY